MTRRSLSAGSFVCLLLLAACASDTGDKTLAVQDTQHAAPPGEQTPPAPGHADDAPQTGVWTSPTAVDLLVVVDDSYDMAVAFSLVEKSVKELANDLVAQGKDLHLAIITTSLGTNGGDLCQIQGAPLPPSPNRRAHPLASADGVTLLRGADGATALHQQIGEVFAQLDARGCGYEQSLEAPYRFLIDPAPPAAYEVDTFGEKARLVGVDDELLAARAAFLRPDSAVVVLTFTSEDDASIADVTTQNEVEIPGYVAFQSSFGGTAFRMRPGTASCADSPESAACRACLVGPSSPDCQVLTEADDNLSVRPWDQKRRFGVDLLQPIDRYVDGYTKTHITDRAGNRVPNPLFAGGRDARSVFVASVVGVPWQDLARDPHDVTQGLRDVGAPGAAPSEQTIDWNYVLGSTSAETSPVQFRPNDPAMVGATAARASSGRLITGETLMPPTSVRWNAVNGREDVTGGASLQAACIGQNFDEATQAGFSTDAGGCLAGFNQDLGCTLVTLPSGEEVRKNCACPAEYEVTTVAADGTITGEGIFREVPQRIVGYPGLRSLEVLRRLGERASAGSICPSNVTDPAAPSFGYRPIIQHLGARIIGDLTFRVSEISPRATSERGEIFDYAMSRPSPLSPLPATFPKPVFEGDLAVFSLVDVIQLVCVIHGVHRVVVFDEQTQEVGRMLVAAAEVVSAQSRYQAGDDAFVELSRLPRGTVAAYPTTYEAEAAVPRLTRSWQELALDAARLEDEERRDSSVDDPTLPVASPGASSEADASSLTPTPQPPSTHAYSDRTFAELQREAVSAYVHRDYDRAVALFEQCLRLRPDDRAVRHNLVRLAKFRRQP
jgi:hypothetical protein